MPTPILYDKSDFEQSNNMRELSSLTFLNKVIREEASHLIIVSLILLSQSWYTQLLCMLIQYSLLLLITKDFLLDQNKKQTSTSGEEGTKSGGMESFKGNLILQGISNKATYLMSKSRRRGTSSNDESA